MCKSSTDTSTFNCECEDRMMRVIEITDASGEVVIHEDIRQTLVSLEDAPNNETIKIKFYEMSVKEYFSLPEYEG